MTANKPLKKMICAALAGVSVFASAMMFSACTTSHPKVEMKIAFHGETYTFEYKLYRKRAPSTVQHFLELVEHGYYDGLCVHDYNSSSENCIRAAIPMTPIRRRTAAWWRKTISIS